MAFFPRLASFMQRTFAPAEARESNEPTARWSPWLERLCAGLGFSLFLAGIIFFFAFNWAAIAPWLKFGMVEAGLLLCLAGVWRWGFDAFIGQLFVCGASLLVGVFLAVFGQIYQTGADAWQLFAGWAALIALWTVLSTFTAQWALLLLLLNTALALYHASAVNPFDHLSFQNSSLFWLQAMGLNAAFFIAREAALARGAAWLRRSWTALFPLALALAAATFPLCDALLSSPYRTSFGLAAGAGSLILVASLVYSLRNRNMAGLALVACAGYPLLNCAALNASSRHNATLLLALVNIGYTVLVVSLLHGFRGQMKEEASPQAAGHSPSREHSPNAGQRPRTAWGLLIISGLGAFIGAPLLVFAIMQFLPMGSKPILIGLLICAFAICIPRFNRGSAASILSLTFLLAGWFLCALGANDLHSPEAMVGLLALLSLAAYLSLPAALPRFLMVLLWQFMALFVCAKSSSHLAGHQAFISLIPTALPLVNALFLVWLAWDRPLPPLLTPVMYAALAMLGLHTLLAVTMAGNIFPELAEAFPFRLLSCLLAGTLFGLFLKSWSKDLPSPGARSWHSFVPLAMAALVLGGLVWLGLPGLLLALALLCLGHGRGRPFLSLLGFLLLPCFLFYFYYAIHSTLLLKSLLLCGSGLLLLTGAVCLYLLRRREESLCA